MSVMPFAAELVADGVKRRSLLKQPHSKANSIIVASILRLYLLWQRRVATSRSDDRLTFARPSGPSPSRALASRLRASGTTRGLRCP